MYFSSEALISHMVKSFGANLKNLRNTFKEPEVLGCHANRACSGESAHLHSLA